MSISIVQRHYLQIIEHYIDNMPSLSTTVSKVLDICNTPGASPNDLNKVISLDPILAGNVLKLINSAYFALAAEITSVTRAIIILGINTIKNLALTTAIMSTIKNVNTGQFSMDAYWSHSLCVGVAARFIAIEQKIPAKLREEFFLAGLLHDLGKVPIASCFPVEYSLCYHKSQEQQISLHQAESNIFGFNHQDCGYLIAQRWKLSQPIVETMKYHHEPEKADEVHRLIISSVAIANLYANIFEIGAIGDEFFLEDQIVKILNDSPISWHNMTKQHESILDSIKKAAIFLQLS